MRTTRRPRTTSVAVLGVLTAGLLLGGMAGVADAQTLTVSPPSVGNDGTKTFTLTGSSFYPSNQEAVELRPNPAIAGQAVLTGTVVDNSGSCGLGLPDSDCGTSLQVTVDTTNAAPGSYDVVETQSPLLGGGTVSTAAKAVTIFAQPRFAASTPIAPAVRGQGSTSTVTVSGTGFSSGITADFGSGTTTTELLVVSPTKLTATVAVAPDAVVGARDVVLTPGAGGGVAVTKTGGFTVTQAPQVDSITPSSLKAGTSQPGAVITGQHFTAGSDLGVALAGVTVTNPTVSPDGTTITADLAVSPSARGGVRTLFLTNGDGGTTSKASAFTVLAPPSAPRSVLALPGDAKVGVSWQPPSDPGFSQGGATVTGYKVTASDPAVPPVTVSGSTLSAVVTGLTNGTSYTFSVVAINGDPGPATTSAAVTPKFATTLTGRLSSTHPVAGQAVTVSGKLTRTGTGAPIAGATIALRFTPQVGSAVTKNVVTKADGTWSLGVAPTYTFGLTATYAGTADTIGRVLSTTVPVAARIGISSPAYGSYSSAATTISVAGSIAPNKAGRGVGLYKLANGTATLIGKATVASNGTYRIYTRLPRGNYVLQVRIGPTPGNASGYSPLLLLHRV
jgi:hypothetical protein